MPFAGGLEIQHPHHPTATTTVGEKLVHGLSKMGMEALARDGVPGQGLLQPEHGIELGGIFQGDRYIHGTPVGESQKARDIHPGEDFSRMLHAGQKPDAWKGSRHLDAHSISSRS